MKLKLSLAVGFFASLVSAGAQAQVTGLNYPSKPNTITTNRVSATNISGSVLHVGRILVSGTTAGSVSVTRSDGNPGFEMDRVGGTTGNLIINLSTGLPTFHSRNNSMFGVGLTTGGVFVGRAPNAGGNTTTSASLHVGTSGTIYMLPQTITPTTCAAATRGVLGMTSTTVGLAVCDGVSWKRVSDGTVVTTW